MAWMNSRTAVTTRCSFLTSGLQNFFFLLFLYIRIRIDFGRMDPDPEGQKWPQKKEKVNKFHVLKC